MINKNSRSPHGERGLKSLSLPGLLVMHSRSPHGERGLKSAILLAIFLKFLVAPPTGSVD